MIIPIAMRIDLYKSCHKLKIILSFVLLGTVTNLSAQHSVARKWNDVLLEAIRNDLARPTVHARNLFHTSVAMYDAWAAYEDSSKTFFLGDTLGSYFSPFTCVDKPLDKKAAQNEALSYASFRLLKHRFKNSPGSTKSLHLIDSLFITLGHDSTYTSINYASDSAAALGNYIAYHLIEFGKTDGSNEINDYVNKYYEPVNETLLPEYPGNPNLTDPNRWQPLSLNVYIDQGGNPLPGDTIPFLSPEWGDVVPFSLTDDEKTDFTRDGDTYHVYHDPGKPPYININDSLLTNAYYRWTFSLVPIWSAQLDPADGVNWDISPASIGNITNYPTSFADHPSFYNLLAGGDNGVGYTVNPHTGQPYDPQIVPRGDYARVLAEFWADGPDSETPPGHWFTLLNDVNDHPLLEKKWKGQGPLVDDLEWDVKSYFSLGGAMHDAAITAWSIKGWHDYIRPISAIRYMADQGQCSDTTLSNYSPLGVPLETGYIEIVEAGDPLEGSSQEHVGKIKLMAWKGPDYISDPKTDMAGVGWILAENWWPYQRPTFVTPPFAGYVSGHSTYSRAAAEVLALITGDPYFPGGMGEYVAKKNEFLVFEEGPSVDIKLQWAKYKDASDQCSLSRIWGGIHPPADDIAGRLIGEKIGIKAFNTAEKYFNISETIHLQDIAICDGDSIMLFNKYQKIAGIYFDSLSTTDGCDSIFAQKLTVNTTYNTNLPIIKICEGDSTEIFGKYEKNSGVFTNPLTTINSCDSIVSQELVIKPTYLSQLQDVIICHGDSFQIFGNYEKNNGTYYNNIKTIDDCDSIITQKLTVNPVYSVQLTKIVICEGDSSLIFGNYEKTSGVYYNNLQTINSCDSIISRELLANPIYHLELTKAIICEGDSLLIFGKYEKTAGKYFQNLKTINDCDSIISQKLEVNPTYYQELSKIEICDGDSALIFGKHESLPGIYTSHLQTIKDCDSIVTQELIVNPVYNVELATAEICDGDSFLIFDKHEKISGTYLKTLKTTKGCDSIFSKKLIVHPNYSIEFSEIKICNGDSTLIFGNYEKNPGTFYNELSTIYGCDSIFSQKLMVGETHYTVEWDTICKGDSIQIGDKYVFTTGIYVDSASTSMGCDSITTTNLKMNNVPLVILKEFDFDSICKQADEISLPLGYPSGGQYSGNGVIGNMFDPEFSAIGLQNVIYSYTDTNRCIASDSSAIIVYDCIGINDLYASLESIKVFPNPNTGIFSINLPSLFDEIIIVKIFSLDSRLIYEKKEVDGDTKIDIDIQEFSKGIYYLQLSIKDHQIIKKIILH